MKPGGQLLITDYGCDNYDKLSEDFKSYIAERGYTLYTVDDYAQVCYFAVVDKFVSLVCCSSFKLLTKNKHY